MRSDRFGRLPHLVWAAALLAALMAHPGSAGSQEAPEITDPAGDSTILNVESDPTGRYDAADIVAAWVGNETDTHVWFYIQAATDIVGGSIGGAAEAEYFQYLVHGTAGETDVLIVVTVRGSGPAIDLGLGASNASVAGDLLMMEVPKAEMGNPSAGDLFTNFYVESSVKFRNLGPVLSSDRAPDADFGMDYVFGGGASAPVGNATDTDGDGLNDTWEQENFGNLTFNATDDPDGDGCDNLCEQTAGTDPMNADTDGDGVNDGDEIAAGTDPTQADGPADDQNGTAPDATPDGGEGAEHDEGDARDDHDNASGGSTGTDSTSNGGDGLMDTLSDNASYLGISVGLFVVVLILAIIGLAGRWAL